jgi:hypothetical protein
MWLAGFAACGSEPKDELANDTWAGMNQEKLAYDCRQVVACNEMRMTDTVGGYDDCVETNAKNLNAQADGQARFLTKYSRCSLHTSCDYTMCVSVDPVSSYGMSQIDKLNYVCQAKAQCGMEMGNPVNGDANVAVANCAGVYVGTLDTWSLDQRNQFVDTFNGCSTLASCQFLACFPY